MRRRMAAKAMVAVGLCWLAVVVVFLFSSFSLVVALPTRPSVAVDVALLPIAFWFLLVGWIVPLSFGLHRLLRR